MNRLDFQVLAEARVIDAEALLAAGRWSAAYYLLGYAVECALKACAAKQFRDDEVPEKTIVNAFYTHHLDKLLDISGAKAAHQIHASNNAQFQGYWNAVRDWNESTRYDHSISEAKARDLIIAVADPVTGVLTWLKTQW